MREQESRGLEWLEQLAIDTRSRLQLANSRRESALRQSRETIRFSANAIRAVHRREEDESTSLLDRADQTLRSAQTSLQEHRELYYAGFLQDAEKEFAEASVFLSLIFSLRVPGPDDLHVGLAPYLNGLGEAVGELRRFVLDEIRGEQSERCEVLLRLMDEIYAFLTTVDYPDGMTGGLRRTTDMVRGVLERTRGDLTAAMGQWKLEKAMRELSLGPAHE